MEKKPPLRKNSSVRLVINQEYLPALLKLLDQAKHQIDILSFSFAIGSAAVKVSLSGAPFEIAQKLKQIKNKNAKNLKIRFFTEGLRETAGRNEVTAKFLAEAGVEVKYGSTHAKGFCVDGRFILFGSTNLTNQSILKNNEANLLIDDQQTAQEFTRYFEHLWNGGKHGEIKLRPPFLADGAFKDVLIRMIDRARHIIEFSIYFFNHREIEQAFINAHKRGVRIIGFIHQHRAFAYPYIRANRATVKRMRAAGLNELHMGIPTTFSHSKYLVVDQKEIALGTGNWLVEDVEIHPQLYIRLKIPELAKALGRHIALQIRTQSTDD